MANQKGVFNVEQRVIKSKILLPLLESSYRDEYTEYSRRNLRCSDAGAAVDEGEKCEREIYYDFTIPEKKSLLSNGTLVLFDDGRIHEADIRRRLRLVLRSPERELSDDVLGARGKIDNMVESRKINPNSVFELAAPLLALDTSKLLGDPVLEIKSVNEFSYQMMARDGKISQSYYDQIQYYLYLSGAKWAICLIKNRNSSGDEKGALPFLEFVVLPDSERQTAIRAGLKTLTECVKDKILPPRPFLKESTKCSYCRYKFSCRPELLEGKKEALITEEKPEAPNKEMLESAVLVYSATQKQIKDLEVAQAEAKTVIERYFKATGEAELFVKNIKALYSKMERTYLDKASILAAMGPVKFAEIAEPVRKLLEEAVADRLIDANVLEKAIIPGKVSYTLRVSENKEKSERIKNGEEGQKGEISKGEPALVPVQEGAPNKSRKEKARGIYKKNSKGKPGKKVLARNKK